MKTAFTCHFGRFFLRKTLTGKLHDNRTAIVFENFRFQNVRGKHQNANISGLKKSSVFVTD